MKLFAQTEDDAILCAQFQKFKPLSVHELGLEQQFQFSSDCPFSSSIQLLQVNAFSRCPNVLFSTLNVRFSILTQQILGNRVVDLSSFETQSHSGLCPQHFSRVAARCESFRGRSRQQRQPHDCR